MLTTLNALTFAVYSCVGLLVADGVSRTKETDQANLIDTHEIAIARLVETIGVPLTEIGSRLAGVSIDRLASDKLCLSAQFTHPS